MATAAVVSGVAGVAGSLISSSASKKAAKKQAEAADSAAQLQQQQYEQTRSDLMPYQTAGKSALSSAQNMLTSNAYLNGTKQFTTNSTSVPYSNSQGGFSFDASDLENTPGYQFNLQQGTRAANNSASASGLGLSGAQLKAATAYASGLADTTYQNQYTNALNAYNSSYNNALSTYNTNYNTAANQYNRYAGLATQGENAAAQTGSLGQSAASNEGNLLTSGANAVASGTVSSANALSSGLSSVSNAYLLSQLYGNNSSSSATTGYS